MLGISRRLRVTLNDVSFNVPLNPRRTLVLSGAFGFTYDNYTFADNYTMEYRDGMMRPVALDGNIKKSKMVTTYFHVGRPIRAVAHGKRKRGPADRGESQNRFQDQVFRLSAIPIRPVEKAA